MPENLPEDDSIAFATEVCWQYYVNGMTQAEVAEALNTTRLRVNQAIQRAKSLGIVKIQIESPYVPRVELQESVRNHLNINRVVIAPARRNPYNYHNAVGAALAGLISERMRARAWKSVGVSWGATLDQAIQRLPRQSHPHLEIISVLGGTAQGNSFNTFGIASGLAERLGANYSLLIAPAYLSEGVDRNAFLSQDIFAAHFQKFAKLDAVILTASDVSPLSFLVINGLPGDVTPESLAAKGAIGDVLGQYLDSEGRTINQSLDNRRIGIDLESVERIPEKILAAAGEHKVPIIRAASKRGLVDTLVTDDLTAELLVKTAE